MQIVNYNATHTEQFLLKHKAGGAAITKWKNPGVHYNKYV